MSLHDKVVASIRRSIDQLCEQSSIRLEPRERDIIANWAAAGVPAFTYHQSCWNDPAYEPEFPVGCACSGSCQIWYRLKEKPEVRNEEESS